MTTSEFKQSVLEELQGNILPYWMGQMQDPAGGFYGRRDGQGELDEMAPKGLILNARILWTFASAYRLLGKREYLETAVRAKREILDRFVDKRYGGAFWSLTPAGEPLDRKKQFYAIAFAIYGLSELYRASGDGEALEAAIGLFGDIEAHSFDPVKGGYLEAAAQDWSPLADMRLSEKDRNDAKTMNTHLHILEGYTALYRVWKDAVLEKQLRGLVRIFLDRIMGPDGHLQLFFDQDWHHNDTIQSFGHDIEASWLLCEAAEVLGDEALLGEVRAACSRIALAAMDGLQSDGSMIYEAEDGRIDMDRHWWVQAENVVGCLNQWQSGAGEQWLQRSLACWQYIRENLVCPQGEWYWSIRDGKPNLSEDRAGFWKCPYHNGRMCMEVIERL